MMNIIQRVTDPMPTNLSYIVCAKVTTIATAIITATISLLSLLLLPLLLLLSYYFAMNHFAANN